MEKLRDSLVLIFTNNFKSLLKSSGMKCGNKPEILIRENSCWVSPWPGRHHVEGKERRAGVKGCTVGVGLQLTLRNLIHTCSVFCSSHEASDSNLLIFFLST